MFESSTISWKKKSTTPFKETQLPSVEGTTLFEGTVLLTKIEPAAFFESYTMIWKYVTVLSITPFLSKYCM